MSETSNKSEKRHAFGGKGFYAVLAVCLIAIGGAAWSATQMLTTGPDTADLSSLNSIAGTPSEQETGNTLSDIPDEREPESPLSSEPVVSEANAPAATAYILPVTGEIIKEFSLGELQYSETFGDLRLHQGIDIRCDTGTKIKAAGEGTVVSVENDALWGVTVTIDHGNGIIAMYCGLDKDVAVSKGDHVQSGTVIGKTGTIPAESVEAPHFHFAVKRDGAYIPPLSLIGAQ